MKTIFFSQENNERSKFFEAVFNALNKNQEADLCFRNEPDKITRVQIQNRNIQITATKIIRLSKLLDYLNSKKKLFKTEADFKKMKDQYRTILYKGADMLGSSNRNKIYVFKHVTDISLTSYYRNMLNLKQFTNDTSTLKPLTIVIEKFITSQIKFTESITDENANAHLAACFSITTKYFGQHQS